MTKEFKFNVAISVARQKIEVIIRNHPCPMAFEIIRDMEPRSLKLKLNTGTQDPILEKQPAEYLKV